MKTASPAKLDALTGLRYVAALCVLLAHIACSFPAGAIKKYTNTLSGIGMPLFFTLSGFLMIYNYSASFQTSYGKTLWRFYVARFARIYPIYIISLLIWLSFNGNFFHDLHDRPDDTRKSLIYVATMTQSWVHIPVFTDYMHSRTVCLSYMGIAWSVSTEVFFYLMFPLFVLPIAWLVRSGAQALLTGLILFAAMMTLNAALVPWSLVAQTDENYANGTFRWFIYLCPYVRMGEFLLGAVVGQYFLYRTALPRSKGGNWWLGAFGLAVCIAVLFRMNYFVSSRHNRSVWLGVAYGNILLAPACAGVIYFFAALPCLLQRFMGSAPMVLLGNASYAIYLMHPVLQSLYTPRLGGEADLKNERIVIYDTVAMVVCMHFICLGMYRYAEVPLRDAIRRLLDPRKAETQPLEAAPSLAMESTRRAA
jgi:peptidoglycan/LPS O-acetylase OafA/YrhL